MEHFDVKNSLESKDSYVGILRNLISKDLSGSLNYGFAPFNIQFGYSKTPKNWWNKNIINLNSRGNSTDVVDGRCFGVSSFHIIDNSPFRFTINDYNVKKIKISYLGGINGVLTVSKGSANVLGTIDCNSDVVEAKMSQIFDLGTIDENTRIIITLTGGTEAYVSGVELIYDENYKTFNNYSLSGTSTKQQVDDTISKECECDFLIWAIGFNDRNDVDSFRINITRYIPIIKAKNCECVVMDFIWDKTNGCKNVLRDMAIALNCKYIDMAELAPRKLNGELIDGFLYEDGAHPEALGHQFIAECIAKKINLDHTTKAIANT